MVGSPTRVCPHCNATLPLKQAGGAGTRDPGSSPRGGGAASGSGPGSGSVPFPGFPFGAAAAGSTPSGGGGGANAPVAGGRAGSGAAGDTGASASVAHFLARHQERFASCKVSQLRRAVAELAAGVRRILDAGRVRDPAVAKGLRDAVKKMTDVKLLQGTVERPRARREVVAHLEAAIGMCVARGA